MATTGMPQLDPTWFPSQLFWLAVAFISLYLIVARSLAPRIQEVLDRRQTRLEGDMDAAARMKTEAAQAKENYESKLQDARNQAAQMLAEASQAIKRTVDEKNRELDASLTSKMEQSERQIEKAKGEVMGKLAPVAGEITGLVLEIILRRKVDAAQIDTALKQSGSGVTP